MTHICINRLTIIDSDNGLLPDQCQAIIRANVGILLIEPLGINCSEILVDIYTFSFRKINLKTSSGKWHPFCLGLNVLTTTSRSSILFHFLTSLVPSFLDISSAILYNVFLLEKIHSKFLFTNENLINSYPTFQSLMCQLMPYRFVLAQCINSWGRVTHISISKLTIIGLANGLSPGWHQAFIYTNAGILLIGPLQTNFSEILIKSYIFSLKKLLLTM